MMLMDRRPILLTNAHILDPSRDLEMDGDLLIADGVIREAKRGIGAAGVPEATEVIDCKGKVVAHDSVAHLRDLMSKSSLEGVFAQLTQPEDSDAIANRILDVVAV